MQLKGLFLTSLAVKVVSCFKVNAANRFISAVSALRSSDEPEGVDADLQRPPRSLEPSRRDVCQILISGIVGTDSKDRYLPNGHYVLDFGLAVVGHFNYIHDWEKYKPTETMWINTEVWDDLAKNNAFSFRKGTPLYGFGYLIANKWTDKNTGEERKQFRLRIMKLLPESEFSELSNSLAVEVNGDTLISPGVSGGPEPIISSQMPPANRYSSPQGSIGSPTSFSSYRPRTQPQGGANVQSTVDPRRIPF